MRILFILAAIGSLFSSCVSDNEEYLLLSERYEVKLDFEIESIEDNGYFIDEIHLEAYEFPTDLFYVVESPEMLDSVFSSITYSGIDTPHLEEFFPNNGILVIYNGGTCYDCYDHTISFSDSSLIIDVAFRAPVDPLDPCMPLAFVFPVGVVPKR